MSNTPNESPVVHRPWYADLVENVSDNPAQIQWPRDEHGITSKLKRAITDAASSVKGQQAKEEVLIACMLVGLAHIRKRVRKDAKVQAKRIADIKAAAKARRPLERFGNTYLDKKEA